LPQCAHAHALALLLHFAFSDLGYFVKVMARCSPLDESAVGMMEVENMDEAVVVLELERAFGKILPPSVVRGALRARSLRAF
jgi:hypothetical protein